MTHVRSVISFITLPRRVRLLKSLLWSICGEFSVGKEAENQMQEMELNAFNMDRYFDKSIKYSNGSFIASKDSECIRLTTFVYRKLRIL